MIAGTVPRIEAVAKISRFIHFSRSPHCSSQGPQGDQPVQCRDSNIDKTWRVARAADRDVYYIQDHPSLSRGRIRFWFLKASRIWQCLLSLGADVDGHTVFLNLHNISESWSFRPMSRSLHWKYIRIQFGAPFLVGGFFIPFLLSSAFLDLRSFVGSLRYLRIWRILATGEKFQVIRKIF